MAGNVIEYQSPPLENQRCEVILTTYSPNCLGIEMMPAQNNTPAAAAWTANRLACLPFYTVQPILVAQMFWVNGGTVNGNSDIGVYSADGQTKLVSSGSTANSGASVIQTVDVTDTVLGANQRFWLVYGSDSGTQTVVRSDIPVGGADLLGVKEQLSGWSSGLPTALTFGAPTVAAVPVIGFTGRSVL